MEASVYVVAMSSKITVVNNKVINTIKYNM
jgi:hypothetical protein